MTRVLVVDNYDSFVYNLVQYLGQLGADVEVRRNDAVRPADLDALGVDGVLLSPGPGTPEDAGASMSFVTACAERELPLLGVCLGHQAIGAVFGAPVVRAPELLHGKTSSVLHDGTGCSPGCRRRSSRRATTRSRSSRTRCRPRSWSPPAPSPAW